MISIFATSSGAVDAFNKYSQLTEVQVLGEEIDWKEIVKPYKAFNSGVVLLDAKKSTVATLWRWVKSES